MILQKERQAKEGLRKIRLREGMEETRKGEAAADEGTKMMVLQVEYIQKPRALCVRIEMPEFRRMRVHKVKYLVGKHGKVARRYVVASGPQTCLAKPLRVSSAYFARCTSKVGCCRSLAKLSAFGLSPLRNHERQNKINKVWGETEGTAGLSLRMFRSLAPGDSCFRRHSITLPPLTKQIRSHRSFTVRELPMQVRSLRMTDRDRRHVEN